MSNHNDVGKMSPESWLFQHEETGVTMYVDDWQVENGFEETNPRLQKIKPIYNQDALTAQVELMKEALQEASNYLDTNKETSIGSGSKLHTKFKDILEGFGWFKSGDTEY